MSRSVASAAMLILGLNAGCGAPQTPKALTPDPPPSDQPQAAIYGSPEVMAPTPQAPPTEAPDSGEGPPPPPAPTPPTGATPPAPAPSRGAAPPVQPPAQPPPAEAPSATPPPELPEPPVQVQPLYGVALPDLPPRVEPLD